MNKLKTMLGLMAALPLNSASGGDPQRRITIHGEWNPDNPSEFISDAELRSDRSYVIENHTSETITVIQWEWTWDALAQAYGRTPRGYGTVLAGQAVQFGAPPYLEGDIYSLTFYLRGQEGSNKLNGRNGIIITEAPEFEDAI